MRTTHWIPENIVEGIKTEMREWLEIEFQEYMDPYHAFTPPEKQKDPDLTYYEQCKDPNSEVGGDFYYTDEKPWEVALNDFRDDFHNCGGTFLHRVSDMVSVYHGTKKEHEADLSRYLDALVEHLVGMLNLDPGPKRMVEGEWVRMKE